MLHGKKRSIDHIWFSARYYAEKNKKLKRVKHEVRDEKKDETSAVNAYKKKK